MVFYQKNEKVKEKLCFYSCVYLAKLSVLKHKAKHGKDKRTMYRPDSSGSVQRRIIQRKISGPFWKKYALKTKWTLKLIFFSQRAGIYAGLAFVTIRSFRSLL